MSTDDGHSEMRELNHALALLRSFLETDTWDAAKHFADANPELRAVVFVRTLVDWAIESASEGDEEAFGSYISHAILLCGERWTDGPIAAAILHRSLSATDIQFREGLTEILNSCQMVLDGTEAGTIHKALVGSLMEISSLAYSRAYTIVGDKSFLELAVSRQRNAVQHQEGDGGDELAGGLNVLASHLIELAEASDEPRLLDEAVSLQRRAVNLTPPHNEDYFGHLNDLASVLGKQYISSSVAGALDEAEGLQRLVLRNTSPTEPTYSRRLSNLALTLYHRYRASARRDLLLEAIELQRESLASMSGGDDTNRARQLVLFVRYLAGDNVNKIDAANWDEMAEAQQDLLSILPEELDAGYEYELAAELTRFQFYRLGKLSLLRRTIGFLRAAVEMTTKPSPEWMSRSFSLAARLADLYDATDNRATLDEAMQLQYEALQVLDSDDPNRPTYLNGLAEIAHRLYNATGNVMWLREALTAQSESLAAVSDDDPQRPAYANGLGLHLRSIYALTGDTAVLQRSLDLQRAAVDQTPEDSPVHVIHLDNLSACLEAMSEVTGDMELLNESIRLQRAALAKTPTTGIDYTRLATNLAGRIGHQYTLAEDPTLLNEALELVESLAPSSPWATYMVSTTKAALLDLSGSQEGAVLEWQKAMDAFRSEVQRLGDDLAGKRDAAQRVDRILGEVAVAHVKVGQAETAISTIESERMWLPTPPTNPHMPETVSVAWVASGANRTAVVSTTDFREYSARLLEVTLQELFAAVAQLFGSLRDSGPDRFAHTGAAVERLCSLSGYICEALPTGRRLLVIPVGICALLPYSAGLRVARPAEGEVTLSLAPSFAWAAYCAHERPRDAESLGAFHPGLPGDPQLDLNADRSAFEELVSLNTLDRPTAEEVLQQLRATTGIGHFSCHGAYNFTSPWDSALRFETALTLRSVLDEHSSPWLVNLSACETAVPDLGATEQMISFPTGFLLGGAAHVVASLWPVSNRSATNFNRIFYSGLSAGLLPAEAVWGAVEALRSGIGSPEEVGIGRLLVPDEDQLGALPVSHPYYWAPYTHWGSPW